MKDKEHSKGGYTFFVTVKIKGAERNVFYLSGPLLCYKSKIEGLLLFALLRSLESLPDIHEKERSGGGVKLSTSYIKGRPNQYSFGRKTGDKWGGPLIPIVDAYGDEQCEWFLSHSPFHKPFLAGTCSSNSLFLELPPDFHWYNPAHIVRRLIYGY